MSHDRQDGSDDIVFSDALGAESSTPPPQSVTRSSQPEHTPPPAGSVGSGPAGGSEGQPPDEDIQEIPPELQVPPGRIRTTIAARQCRKCPGWFWPRWGFQLDCWNCRNKKEQKVEEQAPELQAGEQLAALLEYLERLNVPDELPENCDERLTYSVGPYGEITCTPRQWLAGMLLAVNTPVIYVAHRTGINDRDLLDLQEGRLEPKSFPMAIAFLRRKYAHLVMADSVLQIRLKLMRATDLSIGDQLQYESKLSDLQNQLLKMSPGSESADTEESERVIHRLVPRLDGIEGHVSGIVGMVFRNNNGKGPDK